jgi:phosphotriesterase-related protein
MIMTVSGPLPADSMGVTLIHEHILVDFAGAEKTGYHRWDRDSVIQKVMPYLLEAKSFGVKTILECTPAYLGRDPILMKTLSEKSGLQILTNIGFYGTGRGKYLPDFSFDLDVKSLAALWIKEAKEGIEQTNVYPGFIKISVNDTGSVLTMMDEKIIRAAIETHRQTGLTIVSHSGPDGPAFAQLKIIEEENVLPEAFVWTHAQEGTMDGHIRAAKKGAWISIDYIHRDEIENNIRMITNLKDASLLSRVLISHDAGWYDPDQPKGGEFRGYSDIFEYLIPALKNAGYSQKDIDQLLIINPKEAYAIKVRVY